MIIEVFKPTFDNFQGEPVILYKESKRPVRVVVNLFEQYRSWLNAANDAFGRDKHAPHAAFWESGGPQICRALLSLRMCAGLFFEWESDRKVAYRWITRKPETPVTFSNDYYCICPVKGDVTRSGEGRITVTLPSDEDVSFYFHASAMHAGWLREAPPEEKKS